MRILRSAVLIASMAMSTASAFGERTTPLEGTPPGQLIASVKKAGRIRVIIGALEGELLLKESTAKIGVPAAHNRLPAGYAGSGKIVCRIHPVQC